MRPFDYAALATAYARHRQVHPKVLDELCQSATPTSRVLEVGCGTGNYVVALQSLVGCTCWGIDPSEEMLARAEARSAAVRFRLGQAERLEFEAASFDMVFSVDVIHHVGDRPAYYGEAQRVLRPQGRICTATDSEWIIRHRRPLAAYFPETIAVELARYPCIADLRAMMEAAGFSEIDEHMVELPYLLTDIQAYREKTFSTLHLIPEQAFQRGIEQMERDLSRGPISCVSRYTMVWGRKRP
jgi:ubiquinone/menaquinone biosynthesis C-methylase UbiE